jgi:hypothetical protein
MYHSVMPFLRTKAVVLSCRDNRPVSPRLPCEQFDRANDLRIDLEQRSLACGLQPTQFSEEPGINHLSRDTEPVFCFLT